MTELYGFENGNLMHCIDFQESQCVDGSDSQSRHCIGTVGDVHLTEEIYPLCGNTVQTTFGVDGNMVTVQPNTYTQRVFYDQ